MTEQGTETTTIPLRPGAREVRPAALAEIIGGRFTASTWEKIAANKMVRTRQEVVNLVRVDDAQRFVDDLAAIDARTFLGNLEIPEGVAGVVARIAKHGFRGADIIAEGELVGVVGVEGECVSARKTAPAQVATLIALGLRVLLAAEHGRRLARADA